MSEWESVGEVEDELLDDYERVDDEEEIRYQCRQCLTFFLDKTADHPCRRGQGVIFFSLLWSFMGIYLIFLWGGEISTH